MFPIGDENRPGRLTPFVNYTLIALNVLVFLYQLTLSEARPRPFAASPLEAFIYRWGVVPNEVSRGEDLVTLVTSQFLHGGWAHIGFNMLFLWVFGDNVEDTMGHGRYLAFYLLTGVAAAAAQVLVEANSEVPLVGASGAISGVLGAYIVLFPRGNIRTLLLISFIPFIFLVPAWAWIGFWIALQFFNGLMSLGPQTAETGGGVAYFAHIGGFVAGAVLVLLFRDTDALQRQREMRAGHHAFERVGRIGAGGRY